jgi:hypothetical protein
MTILFGFETLKTDENNGHKNGYQAKKRLKNQAGGCKNGTADETRGRCGKKIISFMLQ